MTHALTEARTAEVASGRKLRALTLGSLGVVYGDIGTSPLYAFREALLAAIGGERGVVDAESVLGVLSLILWALMIVVTAKYVLILLRVHNRGEGGTLALMALAQRALGRPSTIVLILELSEPRCSMAMRSSHQPSPYCPLSKASRLRRLYLSTMSCRSQYSSWSFYLQSNREGRRESRYFSDP